VRWDFDWYRDGGMKQKLTDVESWIGKDFQLDPSIDTATKEKLHW